MNLINCIPNYCFCQTAWTMASWESSHDNLMQPCKSSFLLLSSVFFHIYVFFFYKTVLSYKCKCALVIIVLLHTTHQGAAHFLRTFTEINARKERMRTSCPMFATTNGWQQLTSQHWVLEEKPKSAAVFSVWIAFRSPSPRGRVGAGPGARVAGASHQLRLSKVVSSNCAIPTPALTLAALVCS